MKFSGGLLSFAAIVWVITSNKLQRARSRGDRRRLLGAVSGLVCGVLFLAGFAGFYFAPDGDLGFLLIGVGYGAMLLSYLTIPGPATREDTAQLVLASMLVATLYFTFLLQVVATK